MMYENHHEIDCGSLGKKQALIQFDFDETHRFNESVYIDGIGTLGERLSSGIIDSLMEEIRGTSEYKEALGLLNGTN